MDPVELRLKNYAETDPENGHRWSSKSLRECYRVGAERFGWSSRPRTASRREGNVLVGYGMAAATYPTYRLPASASARITADGAGNVRALVQTASQDLGTGTYTIMTQLAADALGLRPDQVRFELGDSRMPPSPVSGGSMTTASTGSAVHECCSAARKRLIELAIADTVAALGPTISQPNYEVGPEFVAQFKAAAEANARFFKPAGRAGHALFDLPGYVAARLTHAGIGRIEDVARCVLERSERREEDHLTSHHRTGSNPPRLHGLHRARRQPASRL